MSCSKRKKFNLAERAEMIELMKKLYGNDEITDDENRSSIGKRGTSSSSPVAKLSPDTEGLLPQE